MHKTFLKKAAIQSVALMLAVVTLSYALHQYKTVTISASDKTNSETILSSEEISTASDANLNTSENNLTDGLSQALDNESEENDTNLSSAAFTWLIKDADEEIINELSERYLVIKKPRGNNITFQLQDLYVTKSIRIVLKGLTEDDLISGIIGRVNNGEVFNGNPTYTEVISLDTNTTEGTIEQVITKDFGNDIVHGVIVTSYFDETTKLYTSELLIELDSVYAHILLQDEDYYYIDLKKPQEVYEKILVIDAGHGGKDSGALSSGDKYYEKDINLDILLQLKELLDKEMIKVYYTRIADDKVFLRPRVELANAVDCDFFISIHNNANEETWPKGTEILYCNTEFKGVKAKDLADIFKEEVGKTITLNQRGAIEKKIDDIYIMEKAVVPTVLIEVGYLTNNEDMNFLSKTENRQAVAQGIYNGILRAYRELETTDDWQ